MEAVGLFCFFFFFSGLKTVWRSGPGLICVYASAFLTLIGLEITLPVLLNSPHLANPELGLKEDLSAWLSLVTPCPACDPMHLPHCGGLWCRSPPGLWGEVVGVDVGP